MNGKGDDPDGYRDAMVTDDMPPRGWTRGLEIALPQRAQKSEEEIERDMERLRAEAEHLFAELKDLVPGSPPPTLPDEHEKLEKLCVQLRQQIRLASVPQQHNGWLGHRFESRAPGSPRVCAVCAKTIAGASGRCRGRPGRY